MFEVSKIVLIIGLLGGIVSGFYNEGNSVEFLSNKPIDLEEVYESNMLNSDYTYSGLCNTELNQEIVRISALDIEYDTIYPYDPYLHYDYEISYNSYKMNKYKYKNRINFYYNTDNEISDESISNYHRLFIDNMIFIMSIDDELFVSDFYYNNEKIF